MNAKTGNTPHKNNIIYVFLQTISSHCKYCNFLYLHLKYTFYRNQVKSLSFLIEILVISMIVYILAVYEGRGVLSYKRAHQMEGKMSQKNTSAPVAENKMGTMPIGKLLFNMSLPMMISMLVQALYNIVDSIFVANNAAFIYFLNYILFLILGFTVVKPFYASQIGSADVEIMDMGIDYLSTVMIFSFGLFAQVMFERMLTSTGRTIFSRKVYL